MKTGITLFLLILAAPALSSGPDSNLQPHLYSEYAGEWKGNFYVYTPEGQRVKSMEAYHIYRERDPYTLDGKQTVTYEDGSTENVTVTDYVENGKLYCRVESDRFGLKILEGRMEGNQIFWWRREKDAVESYRERITDDGKFYRIDGYGVYGADRSKLYTFIGEYRRVR